MTGLPLAPAAGGAGGRARIGVDLRALVAAPTGTGIYTESLLRQLARRGRYAFVGLSHAPATAAAELAAAGVELEHQRAPLGVIWQQLLLPRRLARGDLQAFWSPLLTLPPRLPIPGVVTVHDLTPLLYPETHRLKVKWSFLPFLERSLEVARAVVVDSESTAADLRFHFPAAAPRLRVVYPGVDPELAPAPAEAIAATRHELDCPEGYLLYVGTLEPRKNLGLLVEVWDALRRERRSMPPLLVAGPYGWGSRRLLRRLAELRPAGVQVLGRLPRARLVALFQAALAFVYPSLYEGFGLPPAEAMACGIPTLACRTSSLPEVVGDAGLLVPPGDGEALRQGIARLLDEPALRAELGQRGPRQAARFTWPGAAADLEAILTEVLGR